MPIDSSGVSLVTAFPFPLVSLVAALTDFRGLEVEDL